MRIVSYGWHQILLFKRRNVYSAVVIITTGIVGFLLAVTQIFGKSPDYFNYDVFFDLVRRESLSTLSISRFELGFSVLVICLTNFLASNLVVYGWIVFAIMLLKGWAMRAYAPSSKIFLVCIGFYLIRYFSLHELTQLRAACAIAFVLVGSISIWNGYFIRGAFICSLALLFHMSAGAVLPALLLTTTKRWQVVFIGFGVFVFVFVFSNLVTGYLGGYIQVLNSYQTQGFFDVKPNPFAIQLLVDWGLVIIALILWDKLTILMRRIVLIQLIGMAIFYGGIELGVVAHRMREFYSVFWVFFLADGLRLTATRVLSYGFVFICMVFYSYVFFIDGKFFS